ncbi:MAG: 1,4-dihydroxy-6-naphthoate synthase [Pseudomonadota bacterium]
MVPAISLGISPCPNDTFIFDAWVNGKLDKSAPPVRCCLDDVSSLNEMAFNKTLDVAKVSFYAYGLVRDTYTLLNAGGALGRGCGPLLVARSGLVTRETLADPAVTIAVPGRWTTANLLLSLYQPEVKNRVFMSFEQIMPAVERGEVDAGVIIHEGRFTFPRYGLVMIKDLGAWWEGTTGLPIPLGAIIAKKNLGADMLSLVEATIRKSLSAARTNPDAPLAFMKKHAREMERDVMRRHVELYVNRHSLDYGKDGMEAIEHLLEKAEEKGLLRFRAS